MLGLGAFVLAAWQQPIVSPYADTELLKIDGVSGPASAPQFGVEELRVSARGNYSNPFDPDSASLDASVTTPSGRKLEVPGFLYCDYSRRLDGANEQLDKQGEPDWRIRICPPEAGKYQVEVHFKDRTGSIGHGFEFSATPTKDPGFVRVSPRDHRYFEFGNGASYFPIGANVCWAGPRGTYDFDDWLPNYGKHGCNYTRFWLAPSWTTLATQKPGKAAEGAGIDQIDLADAWKLDHVLNLAKEDGIYAMLTTESYNILRIRDAYPQWDTTPENKANGGPLRIWSDFWTSPEMDRLYKNKLRYLVARYGAFTHVLSWEFWNEVDLVSDFNRDQVRSWHQRMGDYLRSIDPYHHMLTTSFSNSMGERTIDLLPELDYVQTHLYNSPDLSWSVAYQQSRKTDWGKPHYVGEVGADASGPRDKEDPKGLQIHDTLWVSAACGAAGGAMPWWWDSLIAPHDLYGVFAAFSRFTAGIDFPGEHFQTIDSTLSYADPSVHPGRGDVALLSGPTSWAPDAANKPQTISVHGGKVDGAIPSGILHGIRNHTDLHNPLTIELTEPQATRVEFGVAEVSTYGGANLVVKLDGSTVLEKHFETGDNNERPEAGHKYDGVYAISVPAGKHTLLVNNDGNDWVRLTYRFVGVVPRVAPPVSVWAMVGDDVAIVWARQSQANWRSVIVEKRQIPPAPATRLELPGLATGLWNIQLWDTWAGRAISTQQVNVGKDARLRVNLPSFASDIAVKATRAGATAHS